MPMPAGKIAIRNLAHLFATVGPIGKRKKGLLYCSFSIPCTMTIVFKRYPPTSLPSSNDASWMSESLLLVASISLTLSLSLSLFFFFFFFVMIIMFQPR